MAAAQKSPSKQSWRKRIKLWLEGFDLRKRVAIKANGWKWLSFHSKTIFWNWTFHLMSCTCPNTHTTHHTRLYIYLFFNFAFIVFGTFYLLSGQSMSERIMNGVFTIQVLCVCTKHIVQQQKRLLFVWSFRVYGLCVCVRIETPRITHFIPRFLTSTFLSHTHLPQKMPSTTPLQTILLWCISLTSFVAWSHSIPTHFQFLAGRKLETNPVF
jgi:hypothetical protein